MFDLIRALAPLAGEDLSSGCRFRLAVGRSSPLSGVCGLEIDTPLPSVEAFADGPLATAFSLDLLAYKESASPWSKRPSETLGEKQSAILEPYLQEAGAAPPLILNLWNRTKTRFVASACFRSPHSLSLARGEGGSPYPVFRLKGRTDALFLSRRYGVGVEWIRVFPERRLYVWDHRIHSGRLATELLDALLYRRPEGEGEGRWTSVREEVEEHGATWLQLSRRTSALSEPAFLLVVYQYYSKAEAEGYSQP